MNESTTKKAPVRKRKAPEAKDETKAPVRKRKTTEAKEKTKAVKPVKRAKTTDKKIETFEDSLSSVCEEERQEINFFRFYTDLKNLIQKIDKSVLTEAEKRDLNVYGEKHFYAQLWKLLKQHKPNSLRIPDGITDVFLLIIFRKDHYTAMWPLTTVCESVIPLFVQTESFKYAFLLFRERYVEGWGKFCTNTETITKVRCLWDRFRERPFWYQYLHGCANIMNPLAVRESLLWKDPRINELALNEDGKFVSLAEFALELQLPNIILQLAARSDFEVTLITINRLLAYNKVHYSNPATCLTEIMARYKSRKTRVGSILRLLCTEIPNELRIIISDYTL
jgi:hypothetical protein